MDDEGTRPVVVVGLPRSGTTWTAQALTADPSVLYLLEPDNEDKQPSAIYAKHRLGRYPVLQPGDRTPEYHQLWEWVFSGAPDARRHRFAKRFLTPGHPDRIHDGHRDPVTWIGRTIARNPRPGPRPWPPDPYRRLVAKSIHLHLGLEWLADEFPVDVLVIYRHPANVLASWIDNNLKDARNATLETRADVRTRYTDRWGVGAPGGDPVERMSWRIGLLSAALDETTARHPEWRIAVHEDLCRDPVGRFRTLAEDLGLPWTDANEDYLRSHNEPGEGYRTRRRADDLPDAWQHKLSDRDVATLRATLRRFPITRWTDADFERSVPGPGAGQLPR